MQLKFKEKEVALLFAVDPTRPDIGNKDGDQALSKKLCLAFKENDIAYCRHNYGLHDSLTQDIIISQETLETCEESFMSILEENLGKHSSQAAMILFGSSFSKESVSSLMKNRRIFSLPIHKKLPAESPFEEEASDLTTKTPPTSPVAEASSSFVKREKNREGDSKKTKECTIC